MSTDDIHSFASSLAKFLKNKHFVGFLFVGGKLLVCPLYMPCDAGLIPIPPTWPGNEANVYYKELLYITFFVVN